MWQLLGRPAACHRLGRRSGHSAGAPSLLSRDGPGRVRAAARRFAVRLAAACLALKTNRITGPKENALAMPTKYEF